MAYGKYHYQDRAEMQMRKEDEQKPDKKMSPAARAAWIFAGVGIAGTLILGGVFGFRSAVQELGNNIGERITLPFSGEGIIDDQTTDNQEPGLPLLDSYGQGN